MRYLLTALAGVLILNTPRLISETVASIPVTGFEDGVIPRLGGEGRQPESNIGIASAPVRSGQKSARLHYVFKKGILPRQYVELRLPQPIPGKARSITAWLYGDGSKQQLKMRVTDAEGEISQIAYGLIDWTGWREVTFNLAAKPEVSWGGNNDGKMDMPVKSVAYLVDSPIEPFESDLYFDDITYAAEGERLDFISITAGTPVPGNAFYGTVPVIRVSLTNVLAEPVDGIAVELCVASPGDGAVVCEQRKTVSLAAGASTTFEIKPRITEYGLYHAQVKLDDARQEHFAFSYLPEADAQIPDPTSSFGVSMHFGHGGRGPVENNLRLASDMGIRWLRDDAGWGSIEREKGVYKVPPTFDRFLRISRREWGCEPLIILDYSNTLYEEERSVATEAGRQAFAKWAEFMARTYRDSVTYWEIWNEPNISGFWKPKPNPKDYALLLKAGYEGVKRGNPDAVVVAMATAGIDLKFIENVLKEDTVGYFDAVSVHPYRYPKSPDEAETTVEHLQRAVDLLAKYGAKGTPIYNTEVGWPNHEGPRGLPEQTSADYLARVYTALRSLPDVKATFWYDFQNDGLKRDYNENNFGLLHNDFTPKAPAVAYRMTSRALKRRACLGELDLGPEAKAFLFSGPENEQLVAAWATTGTVSAALRFSDIKVHEVSAAGPVRDCLCDNGILILQLTSTPLFLTGAGPIEAVSPPLTASPAWGTPGGSTHVRLTISNPWKTERDVRFRTTFPEGWTVTVPEALPLPAKGDVALTANVQIPDTAEPGSDQEIGFAWVNNMGSIVARASTVVRVVGIADVAFHADRTKKGLGVSIHATTPLVYPPAVRFVELSLSDAWGGVRRIAGDDVAWKRIWRRHSRNGEGDLPAPRREFSLIIPIESNTAFTAPVPASVTVTFAGGAAVTAKRDVSLWHVPSLSPVVDGSGEEWESIPFVKAVSFDGTKKEACSGPEDCSLGAKVAWDRKNFYLFVSVTDDTHSQTYTKGEVWNGDGIQFGIDLHRASRPSDKSHVEMGLSLTEEGPQVYRWTQTAGLIGKAACVVKRDGSRTLYEAAIPWKEIGKRPKKGTVIGFALLANDNDGKEREGWVPLFDGIGWRKEPGKFGALMF